MDTLRLVNGATKLIAHKGLSGIEMENTHSSFVAAGNRSYWGIETDVHCTADNQFIIIHDDDTARVAGKKHIVEETPFETLRSLHLFDADGCHDRRDIILPSLAEYSRICKKYNKYSVLELKNHMDFKSIESIAESLAQEGWLDKTVFISFDLENMLAIRKLLPKQKAQFLAVQYTDDLLRTLENHSLDLDIHYKALTAERVRRLHNAGVDINVWTVDGLEDAQRLVEYGVDYITSNIIEPA